VSTHVRTTHWRKPPPRPRPRPRRRPSPSSTRSKSEPPANAARSSLSPETGSTIYRFDTSDIAKLPQGDATPLNQVLLRAPGVVADSYGQVHVRGDHGNLQYRINGVVIPESISGFGQTLDTRFANRINVLTGALPAQYGYRTAGVVDIHAKGADLANGGSVDAELGSRGHQAYSANIGGTQGDLQYYVMGSTLHNHIGIENPMPSNHALHDDTRQDKGFAYLSYLLGSESRVGLMLGASNGRFQIPNVVGEAASFALAGATPPASENLDANQRERNDFQVLTLQSNFGDGTDYQVSLFRRASSVHYRPDPVGDLSYHGVAANVLHTNLASGVQFDLSRPLGADHTLRAGLFAQRERGSVTNASTVFPADGDGNQTSDVPLTIHDDSRLGGGLFGVYLQDEWQPTQALTLNYGLRYDKVSTVVDESQLSPRLGIVYQLAESTRLHAGYARYFTPPPTEKIDTTSVQKFLGTTNALPSDANTAVRSERSNYFDLGVSHQLDLLPPGQPSAGRRPVRQRANLLSLQLCPGPHLRPGAVGFVQVRTVVGVREPGPVVGTWQGHRDRSVQLRRRRVGLHREPLGSPRPRTDGGGLGRGVVPAEWRHGAWRRPAVWQWPAARLCELGAPAELRAGECLGVARCGSWRVRQVRSAAVGAEPARPRVSAARRQRHRRRLGK